ncbi:MAG: hypothetical protein ACFE8U_10530 [Candidatus Hermodarchaeota archaeon]
MVSLSTIETSLIWGNLRNLIDFNSVKVLSNMSLVGTISGQFPVSDFHPIFLEVPKSHKKLNMSGRKNFSQVYIEKNLGWVPRRIVSLPNYENDKNVETECLKSIIQLWETALIPEEIPCIALGVNITGQNSDGRERQYVVVLLIWENQKTRILELDWFEGPLDDCITPEWYLQVSEIMNIKKSLIKMRKIFKIPPNLKNPLFLIYSIPPCLGSSLQTKWEESNIAGWKYQLSFHNHEASMRALESLLEQIHALFY